MTRHRRSPSVGLVAILLALVGGCGLSANDEPQIIAAENLPPGLLDPNPGSSTTLADSPTTSSVTVFFLGRDGEDERLIGVKRDVANSDSPGDRLSALFSQPPTASEDEEGITTALPADLVLLEPPTVDAEAREVSVNLSSELSPIQGAELSKAFAQIVFTVTELDEVSQVRFFVDGEPIPVQDAEGVEKTGAVSRADYRALDDPSS